MTVKSWYDVAFGSWYERLYAHRSLDEARSIWKELHTVLPARGSLLDIGCGNGRHMRVLGELGYDVVGLDRSSVLLQLAHKSHVKPLVRGDMRRLPFRDSYFDAALSMFTSFGYFSSQEEHRELLCEWSRILKPGGRLVLDYLNPSYVREGLEADSERCVWGIQIKESRRLARRGTDEVVQKKVTIVEEGTTLTEYTEEVALYNQETILSMAEGAGFRKLNIFGNYCKSPLSPGEPRAIYILGT